MEPKHTIELLVLHDSVVLIRPAQCKQEEPILDGDDLEFASSDDVDPGRCQREILIHKFSGTFHSCAIGGGEQRNNRDGIEKQHLGGYAGHHITILVDMQVTTSPSWWICRSPHHHLGGYVGHHITILVDMSVTTSLSWLICRSPYHHLGGYAGHHITILVVMQVTISPSWLICKYPYW
ncbi:hypothetical protein RRG08_004413 [Elysia crispata]|uniref:Uncharacterized protein n=1 Tax=Elysia crispata TaxID=231223 RepID=A0AAE0Y5S0_9GAST|nr:hypothetical protein RRG08_004413 [Elysia crispata]